MPRLAAPDNLGAIAAATSVPCSTSSAQAERGYDEAGDTVPSAGRRGEALSAARRLPRSGGYYGFKEEGCR